MRDISMQLQHRVIEAAHKRQPLRLHGGNSKAFYGNPVAGDTLDLSAHTGVVSYEPTELVITARGATPLHEIDALLAHNRQRLVCEPPGFGGSPTIGGMVASGLSGPARPWGGAVRDQLLGVRLLDGQGRVLNFGGQVMKNVAGYDVSRLMAGAQGTLGILLEVSLKVLPAPSKERTLSLEMPRQPALARMRELARQPVPLSGAAWHKGQLYLRLSGSHSSVNAWRERLGGERLAEHSTFWQRLRDLQLDYFQREQTLWRLSLPAHTPLLDCEQDGSLLDWAGAQRWLFSHLPAAQIRAQAEAAGGHAEAFRRGPADAGLATQTALDPLSLRLHQALRKRFDPQRIFNPGRLFDE